MRDGSAEETNFWFGGTVRGFHSGSLSDDDTMVGDQTSRIVSIQELALIWRVSENTIRTLMYRHTDFPVLVRGKRGVPWQIDRAAATVWRARLLEREVAARETQRRWIADAKAQYKGRQR